MPPVIGTLYPMQVLELLCGRSSASVPHVGHAAGVRSVYSVPQRSQVREQRVAGVVGVQQVGSQQCVKAQLRVLVMGRVWYIGKSTRSQSWCW